MSAFDKIKERLPSGSSVSTSSSPILIGSGVPTSETGGGKAGPGSIFIDTTTRPATKYRQTGTVEAPVWTKQ